MTRLVSHEHLRAHLRVVPPVARIAPPVTSCECHGIARCPADRPLDTRARHAEGQLPIGFTPEPYGIETSGQGLETCIAIAAVIAIVLTVGWLAYFVFGWVLR